MCESVCVRGFVCLIIDSFLKLHTFMMMYKTHCQRILDSVVRANFLEVSVKGVGEAYDGVYAWRWSV